MTQIRYIGLKPVKQDNVANTGLIWNGAGDVHEVADLAAAAKLLSYPLVWEETTDAQAAAGKSTVEQVVELDALRERAKELGVDVKGTWGIPRLTKAITDAQAAAGKSA
jgi:hypothetical protein